MRAPDVDGRLLVILQRVGSGFSVVASGRLMDYGDELKLNADTSERTVSEAELAAFQPVISANRIKECQGFDFFLLRD